MGHSSRAKLLGRVAIRQGLTEDMKQKLPIKVRETLFDKDRS
jgi:hypothetical protein